MREILYKLAHRVISTAWKSTEPNAERFYLYLRVLRELKLHDEALELLRSEVGQILCVRSLACDEMRRYILQDSGAIAEASEAGKKRIADGYAISFEMLNELLTVFAVIATGSTSLLSSTATCQQRVQLRLPRTSLPKHAPTSRVSLKVTRGKTGLAFSLSLSSRSALRRMSCHKV